MKKGFTLIEVFIMTAMVGLLLLASIPFLINVSQKQVTKMNRHDLILVEFSDINYALESKTKEELEQSKTKNIVIEKVADFDRLYSVKGVKTNVVGYIVLKQGG